MTDIEVSIPGVDGSLTKIKVERNIVDHEAVKLPAGFRACLVTQSAQAVAPRAEILKPQADDRPKLSLFRESCPCLGSLETVCLLAVSSGMSLES